MVIYREGAEMLASYWKRIIKVLAVIVLTFCVIVTTVVGGALVTNASHLGRMYSVWSLIKDQYLENTTTDQLIDGAMKGIVESLNDPYSQYLSAEENQELFEQLEGKFGGIGIILSLTDPTKLIVSSPVKNSPAIKADIQAGDQIMKIDDVDTSTIDQDKAVSLMRGDPGTKVTLTIYRDRTKETLTKTLTRENIVVPTVEASPLPGNSDIAYIDISQFSPDTGTELGEALKSLDISKYKGIILDLRNNHGGELNAAVTAASYFIPAGPVVHIVDKKGNTETKNTDQTYLGLPLVVLVNGETASASEIVSGAIKDNGSGTLVGTKTFGKGIVQTIFPLDSGTSVKLTTAKYLTPKKIDIHKKGIEPDVSVDLGKDEKITIAPTTATFDTQLTKAIEVIKSKLK